MTKEEAFNLIEKNRWAISPQCNGGWVIDTAEPESMAGDASILEIARTRGSLLDAVKMAKDENVLAVK